MTESRRDQPIRALIITGHDHFHHRWRASTRAHCEILERSEHFSVRITEEFTGATAATLRAYDVVLLNYFGADAPGMPEHRWGRATEQALFDFVARGGGLVACHTSFRGGNWGDDHADQFARMLGGVTRSTSRRVGNTAGFAVEVMDPGDEIVAGLPSSFVQVLDDKMVNLTWHPSAEVQVLLSVYDDPAEYLNGNYYAVDGLPGPKLYDIAEVEKLPGVGRHHPVCWKQRYGEGRVFALTLGHVGATTLEDAHATRTTGRYVGPTGFDAVNTAEFATLLTRGAEWAATAEVTLPYGSGFRPGAPNRA